MEFANRRIAAWLLPIFMAFLIQSQEVRAADPLDDRYKAILDSAEILKLKSHYDAAIEAINQVKDASLANEKWDIYTRSLIELADVLRFTYYYSKDPETITKAYALFDKAGQIISQHLDTNHIVLSRYHIYKGKLIRDQGSGDSETLLYYLNRAWKILEFYPDAYDELAKLHYETGYYHYRKAQTNTAEGHYEKLIFIINRYFDELDYFRGFYLHQAGTFFFYNADYEKSLLCSNLALYIFEHPIHHDVSNALSSGIIIANSYYNSNINTRESFTKALSGYKKVYDTLSENLNNHQLAIITLSNIGACLYELGAYDSCAQTFKIVISLTRQRTSAYEKSLEAKANLFLGLINSRRNNTDLAAIYYEKAINDFVKYTGSKTYETHVIFRAIGEEYERIGQYEQALQYFQNGLISLFENFNSDNIFQNPEWDEYENIEPVLYILFDKASALFERSKKSGSQQDLKAAFGIYEQGYALIRRLLNTQMMNESFINLFQNFKGDFQTSVECAIACHEIFSERSYLNATFSFMEQSKYFLLLKSQQNALLKQKLGKNSNLFITERTLNREIENLKHQLNKTEKTSPDKAFELRNILLGKTIEKSGLWVQLSNLTDTTQLENQHHSIALTEVQEEILTENEIIVEYYRAETMIYALVIGRSEINVVKIPVSEFLLDEIRNYTRALSHINPLKESFLNFSRSSNNLYRALFEPVVQISANPSNSHEISYTLITDGELAFLPFEAFTTALADTTNINYWGLPYLCKDISINYAYSLNMLHKNISYAPTEKNNKILAMSYSASFDEHADVEVLRVENELPYSSLEIEEISNIFPHADYHAIKEATEDQFKSVAPDFSIIHLAIHGNADTVSRYDSRLLFKTLAGSTEDGQLFAYELYNMDLTKTQLVVLSACETGHGKQIEGEGIFSISRGFAYAGCPAMVMSLWKVNDKSTAMLMKYYYENLALGMKKDKALQQAKLSFIHNSDDYNAHPANWAAFVAIGNNRPIVLEAGHSGLTYVLLAILVVVLGAVFINYRIKAVKYNEY